MENEGVSVVLAVYNGELYLNRLLNSILSQIDVNISEVIIVDDCSSDGSLEIVESYKKLHDYIIVVKNQINSGPISSFVNGAKIASSKYVAFADQDDIWIPEKLSLSLKAIYEIDDGITPALVFTDLKMIDEFDNPVYDSFWDLYKIKPHENVFFTILFANIVTGCTILINKSMLLEFIDMPLEAQMHDHWIALIASSFGNWKFLKEKTVLYRIHQNSVTVKRKITLGRVLLNFFEASTNKNSIFLKDYIYQAELFKTKYQGRLDKKKNNQLNYFIGLKNSPGIMKKMNSKFRVFINKLID